MLQMRFWPRSKWLAVAAIGLAGTLLGGSAVAISIQTGILDKAFARLDSLLQNLTPAPDYKEITWRRIETGLLSVEVAEIPLGEADAVVTTGGGVSAFGDGVIFASGKGRIGYVDLAKGRIRYLEDSAPMNLAALERSDVWNQPSFSQDRFRVNDIMVVKEDSPERSTLVVNHEVFQDNQTVCTVVSTIGLTLRDGLPEMEGNWRTLFVVKPCTRLSKLGEHFEGHKIGGQMYYKGNGRFLMTVGEWGWRGVSVERLRELRANPEHHLTKLLELDLHTGDASVVAEGLRSPNGIHIDQKGRIWETEHGPQGGDELNLVHAGTDYGWPWVSYGVGYGDYDAPRYPLSSKAPLGRHDNYEPPVFAFMPAVGIGQLIDIPSTSRAWSAWRGDLLAVSLREQTLYRFRLDGDRVAYVEPIRLGHRLRDIIVLPDERLAIVTDDKRLLILRDPTTTGGEGSDKPLLIAGYDAVKTIEASPDEIAGSWERSRFLERCGSCHSVDDSPGIGPNLAGIVGRKIGSVNGYRYSTVLSGAQGSWTEEQVMKFALDPQAIFPGTTMPPVSSIENMWALRAAVRFTSRNRFEPTKPVTHDDETFASNN